MLETKLAKFEVVGQQNNHLWLEVISEGDQGMRVSVPLRHDDYEADLQNRVLDLKIGDIAELTLKSKSENPPDWRISEIEDIVSGESNSGRKVPA